VCTSWPLAGQQHHGAGSVPRIRRARGVSTRPEVRVGVCVVADARGPCPSSSRCSKGHRVAGAYVATVDATADAAFHPKVPAAGVSTPDRIVKGSSVVDPALVQELLATRRVEDPPQDLSPRGREVLALMAEGLSNSGIAHRLWPTEGTIVK
jgi:hypothetical protein